MNENFTIHKRTFEHHALEGTHYEIGMKEGEFVKKQKSRT